MGILDRLPRHAELVAAEGDLDGDDDCGDNQRLLERAKLYHFCHGEWVERGRSPARLMQSSTGQSRFLLDNDSTEGRVCGSSEPRGNGARTSTGEEVRLCDLQPDSGGDNIYGLGLPATPPTSNLTELEQPLGAVGAQAEDRGVLSGIHVQVQRRKGC